MIAGVLLAAGASQRMGRDKALLKADGDSFLVRGVRNLWTVCDRVVVVLGAHHAKIRLAAEREFAVLIRRGALNKDFRPRLGKSRLAGGIEVHFIVNRHWRRGMLSSVRAGLADALAAGPESVLVMPVDHPDVDSSTVYGLALLMHEARQVMRPRERRALRQAMIPRHRGRRGHPIVLSPALAERVVADRAADDLSDAIRRSAALVAYVDVADPGVVRNRNQPGD